MLTTIADLSSRLRVSVARLARRLRQEGADGDTPSQLAALASLYRLGPVTLGDLADAERVRPPTMTRIVAALEERGLLRKQPDAADRRVVRVALTPEGKRAYERTRRRRDEWLAKRLATLPRAQLDEIERAIQLLDALTGDDAP